MIGLLQRVSQAEVFVTGQVVASIGQGLLVLVGVERNDTEITAGRLARRLMTYRVFPDAAAKMNLDVGQVGGEVLLVPQFTLAADTASGTRASFASAADGPTAQTLFELLVVSIRAQSPAVQTGIFGADMKVRLTNDGPVTFLLRA